MPQFKETLEKLQSKIKSRMTKETPDEELTAYGDMLKDCDELENSFKETEKAQMDYREKYIESVKNFGTRKSPQEDKPAQGRSLEEIIEDVLSEDKK